MSGGGSSGSSQSTGFGSSYSNSASLSLPQNMTSPYWQAQTKFTADDLYALQKDLGQGSNNSILQSFLAPYGGSFAAPVTDAQNTTLGNIGSAGSGNYSYNPAASAEQNQLLYEMQNPEAFGQQLASGLPINAALAALAANPNQAGSSAASALQSLLPGFQNPVTAGSSAASGLAPFLPALTNPNTAGSSAANSLYSTLAQTDPQLMAMLQPGWAASNATGSTTQGVIDAALQPIKTQFNTQTAPGLQSSFAQAGQRGSGMGSSAFGMSFANAQAQELATEAATSGNIVNTIYNTGLNLAGTAANNVAGLESGAFGQGYGGALSLQQLEAGLYGGAYNTGYTGANTSNLNLSTLLGGAFGQGYGSSINAQDLLQSERANLYGTGVNASLNAPGALNSLNSSQINDLVQTLNAQALPQLTQQLGINNALTSYNTSINSLLSALGLQVQAEQPVVGYESENISNSGSFQNEQSSGSNNGFQFSI